MAYNAVGQPTMTLLGKKIFIVPSHPKYVLSEDVPVTPEFRARFNMWALEFFGMESLAKDGEAISTLFGIFVNERTYHQLKEGRHAYTFPGR